MTEYVLNERDLAGWSRLAGADLIAAAWVQAGAEDMAVLTSFGIESAVLLDLAAQVDRTMPVIFVDTGRLFPETLAYRDDLIAQLGLTSVRTVRPERMDLQHIDPDWGLYRTDADACCRVRKVDPYARAVHGKRILVTGRKRFHGAGRSSLSVVEPLGHVLKLNPLANWTSAGIDAAFDARGLPRHPLAAEGYTSVGCAVCTARPEPDLGGRSGRWAGTEKTECGIHFVTQDGAVRTADRPDPPARP